MSTFTIEGMENLRRIMREYPEKGYRRPVMTGFRRAGTVVKRIMIANLPSELKPIRKAIKGAPEKSKEPAYRVGIFANQGVFRNSNGVDWDPYQIGYWSNYGTLANRFIGHAFKTRRKRRTAGWKGGIKPLLFMERAWEMSKGKAQQTFEEVAEKEAVKWLEKNAYK